MSVLDTALQPVARLLNRNIAAVTPARELCRQLAGKTIAIRVENSAIAAQIDVKDDKLELRTDLDDNPDVIISGSLLTLLGTFGQSNEAAIRDGELDLTGDAETASQFQRLLTFARPDIEEQLSEVIGDVASHRIGEIARGLGRWGRDARSTLAANIREYLQEESRETPSRYEIDRFARNVGDLRDAVDRAAARLDRLEAGD